MLLSRRLLSVSVSAPVQAAASRGLREVEVRDDSIGLSIRSRTVVEHLEFDRFAFTSTVRASVEVATQSLFESGDRRHLEELQAQEVLSLWRAAFARCDVFGDRLWGGLSP